MVGYTAYGSGFKDYCFYYIYAGGGRFVAEIRTRRSAVRDPPNFRRVHDLPCRHTGAREDEHLVLRRPLAPDLGEVLLELLLRLPDPARRRVSIPFQGKLVPRALSPPETQITRITADYADWKKGP